MICQLPTDIIELIIKNIPNCQDLISLKMSSYVLYTSISKFTISKHILSSKLYVFTKRRLCINRCCYDDTEDIFINVHNYYYKRYVHTWQEALNTSKIIVNNKTYAIKSHYCCECFKKYVLVGNNEKAVHNYRIPNQVNVTFCK